MKFLVIDRKHRYKTNRELAPFFLSVRNRLIADLRIDLDYDLRDNSLKSAPILHVFSHGGPYSWLATVAAMGAHYCENGLGDRRITGVFHRMLYEIPGVGYWLRRNFGETLKYDGYLQLLKQRLVNDLALFPEGDLCVFGNAVDIGRFRSSRFVELALESGAQICVYATVGHEAWNRVVPLDRFKTWQKFRDRLPLPRSLRESESIVLPWLPQRLEQLQMRGALFTPELKLEDLSSNLEERRQQLDREAERIRAAMQGVVDSLKDFRKAA